MSKVFKARVADNVRIADSVKLITLIPLETVDSSRPGQFFMLEAGYAADPLLKRPFSVFRSSDGALQFLYRIRGKGTLYISNYKEGDIISVLGPLGNSWPEPDGDFVVLAGGIGVASLYSLIETYPGRAMVFCGFRSCDELLMIDEIKRLAKNVSTTTDDGSYCRAGFVTDPFAEFIESEEFVENPPPIFACGPAPMLKRLASIVKGKNMKCYVSLEEAMACGVGACLGCVCSTGKGYTRICKEGPIFDIEDIIWD